MFHRQDYDINVIAAKIEAGLKQLHAKSAEMDVMLLDPQYVTAMLLDDKAELSERMVKLISDKAELFGVNVFHRWALMRHWHVLNNISFERMLDPTDTDKLHQSDASTQRLSRGPVRHDPEGGDGITRHVGLLTGAQLLKFSGVL